MSDIVKAKKPTLALERVGGVALATVEDAFRVATAIHSSGLGPKGLDTPQKVMVVILAGQELGLRPIASMNWLYPINGKVGIMGDAAKSLVRSRGGLKPGSAIKLEPVGPKGWDVSAPLEKWTDTIGMRATAWRAGDDEAVSLEYWVIDAKRAGLWLKKDKYGKPGPWCTSPMRMMGHRAWGRLASDLFSDILMGVPMTEILQDTTVPIVHQRSVKPGPDPLLTGTEPNDTIQVDMQDG